MRYWKNKKVPGYFTGHYVRDADGERVFVLKRDTTKTRSDARYNKSRRITFESAAAAKALGWMLL